MWNEPYRHEYFNTNPAIFAPWNFYSFLRSKTLSQQPKSQNKIIEADSQLFIIFLLYVALVHEKTQAFEIFLLVVAWPVQLYLRFCCILPYFIKKEYNILYIFFIRATSWKKAAKKLRFLVDVRNLPPKTSKYLRASSLSYLS